MHYDVLSVLARLFPAFRADSLPFYVTEIDDIHVGKEQTCLVAARWARWDGPCDIRVLGLTIMRGLSLASGESQPAAASASSCSSCNGNGNDNDNVNHYYYCYCYYSYYCYYYY